MKNILVVSTSPGDPRSKLQKYVEEARLPAWNWYTLVEYFGEELPPETEFHTPVDDFLTAGRDEEAISRACSKARYDAVIHWDEFSVLTGAKVRARLGLPGPTFQELLPFRDKVLMKERLAGVVRTPKMIPAKDINESMLPIVAKPRACGGSRGVRIVRNMDELRLILHSGKQPALSFEEMDEDDLSFEEYIEAPIFHIDGVVQQGRMDLVAVSRYIAAPLGTHAQYPVGSVMLDSSDELGLFEEFTGRIIASLKLPDGAFHLEAFRRDGEEPIFLEIGARPGGAYIVPTIDAAKGIDLRLAHICLQLHLTAPVDKKRADMVGAWLIFPRIFSSSSDGRLLAHRSRKVARAWIDDSSSFRSLHWMTTPERGFPVCGGQGHSSNNLGGFIFCGQSRQEVLADIEKLREQYHVECEDGVRLF